MRCPESRLVAGRELSPREESKALQRRHPPEGSFFVFGSSTSRMFFLVQLRTFGPYHAPIAPRAAQSFSSRCARHFKEDSHPKRQFRLLNIMFSTPIEHGVWSGFGCLGLHQAEVRGSRGRRRRIRPRAAEAAREARRGGSPAAPGASSRAGPFKGSQLAPPVERSNMGTRFVFLLL